MEFLMVIYLWDTPEFPLIIVSLFRIIYEGGSGSDRAQYQKPHAWVQNSYHTYFESFRNVVSLITLLGGRHKEGRSIGTGRDPIYLKHRKGEGRIAADVVLNIGI